MPQFVGLLVFLAAEIGRDEPPAVRSLPEAESELVAGYHTEYSGMRFGLFSMAEYVNVIVALRPLRDAPFGGWLGPWAPLGPVWFLLKVLILIFPVHLAARDAAAPALRPADGVRLEGPAPRSRR